MTDESKAVLNPGEKVQPDVSKEEAGRLLQRLYGMSAIKVDELSSYDDKNFHIHVDTSNDVNLSENGYVLKILNSLDSKFPEAIEAQNRLILHVADRSICTSRPLPNLRNELWSLETLERSGDAKFIVRLFTYVPGKIFLGVRYSPSLVHSVGKLAGKLNAACSDFFDPAFSNYKRIWSLTEVPKLTKFVGCLKDVKKEEAVLKVVKEFDEYVVSNYSTLKKGMIHGDLSDNNILIKASSSLPGDYEVVGFLDFGDATEAYYVFEIAILICYVMINAGAEDDPIELGGHALAGYLSEFPLSVADLSVLKICIAGRLIQTLVLGAYTASMEPENAAYVLQTQARGWEQLFSLCARSDQEVFDSWDSVLKLYNLTFKFKESV